MKNVFTDNQLKTDLPEFRSGDTIRVWQRITEGKKDRLQAFEGLVVARKHGSGISATFTVRKTSQGIGIEKIYPLHSPTVEKIEVIKVSQNRKRSKMYWTRERTDRVVRLKLKPQLVKKAQESPKVAKNTVKSEEKKESAVKKTAKKAEKKDK